MGLLDGKIGLIFGIANDRSYAWYIAKAILEHGGRCAFAHLPGEKNERRTRKAVDALGVGDPWLMPCDAGQDGDLDAIFHNYALTFERMDYLIHSIAFADKDWLAEGKFTATPRQVFNTALDISAYTFMAMANRAAPLMTKGGSILGMSYYGAEKAVRGYNVMGVAKSALESAARYLAFDLGASGIRVNIISGGPMRTLSALGVGGFSQILEWAPQRAPLRRNIDGHEVGDTAVWLVSDLSSGVTGETVHVDAGFNAVGL
jgi:enoyl-[acyl-carrier protein] reductase I